ncbi:MAG: hypothetical protein K0R23_765 [Lacrimispora sp.]|jgi:ABC-type uncharacterized transport system permease subunit|nr:hypothetical protein [Lacrimispora sp.]
MKQVKTILSGCGFLSKAVCSTILICSKQIFDGGFLCIAGGYFVQIVQFVLLTFIWKTLAETNALPSNVSLNQLMTYTLMSAVLHQELNIISPATSSLWEGSVIGRFLRPMAIEASFISETIGRFWIPNFLFMGIPLLLLAPLLSVSPFPDSFSMGILSLISLVLAVTIGFAIDLLFASLAMNLKNGCFAALAVREAVYSLLSGEMIPFSLFPKKLGTLFSLLPLGSVAHGPLTIYTGTAHFPLSVLALQFFWAVALWALTIYVFNKSKERMISFGG